MPRARSYNEQVADEVAEHAIRLLRYDSDTRARILAFLARLRVTLAERIRLFGVGKAGTEFSRARLRTLYAQVGATIREAFSEIADAHTASLIDLAAAESSFAVGTFSDVAIQANVGINLLTRSQLRNLAIGTAIDGAPSREWWSAQAGDLVTRFRHEIEAGIATGETTDEIVRRIRGRATGRRNAYELNGRRATYVEFAGGVMDTSTRHALSLVRTSVQAVSGAANRETYAENQDVVKGIVQISTLDTRTTPTCIAYGGKAWALPDYEPIGHDLPYAGGIPRHWGAIPAGEPVLTALGPLPIEKVRVGDFVVTHRGRYRRVYATMSKPGGPLPLVGIETESGRVLWATQEHPVLTVGRGWQRADQIRSGDELLEHPEQAMQSGLRLRGVPASEDCPTVFDEEPFFRNVLFSPGEVPSSVNFESDFRFLEGEVDDPPVDRVLEDEMDVRLLEGQEDGELIGLRVGAVDERHRGPAAVQTLGVSRRVPVAQHPLPMDLGELRAGLGVSRPPVGLSARPVDPCQSKADGIHAIAHRDSVALAGRREGRLAEPESSLDRPNRLSGFPVRRSDQSLDLGAIGRIQAVRHWHASKVRRVIVASDTRDVYNLAVAGDETYLSGGFVVHNCRSREAPLLRSWQELGINLREAPGGTRWSRLDGDVPTDITMDAFLRRRSDAQVDEMLGDGVAALWRSGQIRVEDLIDRQSGRPLSLAELTARHGRAA